MEDIRLSELKSEKTKLELEINQLLYQFEVKTGVVVNEISFVRRSIDSELGVEIDMVYCTEAKVIL